MRSRQIWAGILAFAVAALAVVFVRLFKFFDSMVAMTGLIVAVILIILRVKSSGLNRFYVLAVVSLVLGLVLSVSGLPSGYSLGLFYSLVGVCLMFSGGITLWHYLSDHPLPAEDLHGR